MSDLLFFNYARTALYYGIKNLKLIKKNNKKNIILVPSYICNTIIQPLKDHNLHIKFYNLNYDLSPQWKDLEFKNERNIFAILYVNYFGLTIDNHNFYNLKEKYDCFLIEDSSHGFFGFYKSKEIGSFGDISILSPRKNLPMKFGGVLRLNCRNHIKNIYKSLKREDYIFNGYLNFLLSLFFFKQKMIIKKLFSYNFNKNFINDDKEESIQYKRLDYFNEIIINNFNWKKNSKVRIQNFNYWLRISINNNFDMPFRNFLSEDNLVTPWCFPIIAKDEDQKKKIINWTVKNNYLAFSWTTLPDTIKDKTAKYLSNNMICFSTYSNPRKCINDKI